MGYQEFTIEGRNAVIEAYRAGKPIDKLFISSYFLRCHDALLGFVG